MQHPHHSPTPHHQREAKRKLTSRAFFRYVLLAGLSAFALGSITLAIISATLPDIEQLSERDVKQSTKIYDRTGEVLLYEIFDGQKRTVIDIKDLPAYVPQATVAIEDKNFYNHGGIAWKSLARAIFSNVFNTSSGQGGASTLTQQLVKNAIVGDEHSLFRKVKEALLALKIERKYTKEEILNLYLNEIPYGSTNYGVESAARNYFGKSAHEVTISEAATLAALPQAPSRYLNNIPRLTERRNYILDVMVAQNYLTKEEAELAKKDVVEIKQQAAGTIAPHFVMMIKDQLTDVFGVKTVDQGGLTVITTLDVEKQKIAQEEIVKGVEVNRKNYNAQNAALVSLDPKSGDILAMVGSRNFFDKEYDGQVNVALRPRQPGSSFKPLVYLMGFAKGYRPETILYDVKTEFSTDSKPYSPNNYDGGERGPISLRSALQGSLNIPAVKMLYLVGVDNVLKTAQTLGYTTLSDRSRFGLSLVLGGGEVTLLEHTNVFATFARGGKYLPTQSILEVKDAQQKVLYQKPTIEPKDVLDADAVATLSNVLSDNEARTYIFGANSNLQLNGRPVAAKTGTTNDYRDGWLMGYTPSLVTGVWAGNNDNSPMKAAGGSLASGGIWKGYMTRALANTPVEQFPPLPEPKIQKPILLGQDPSVTEVEIDSVSGKLATEFTPPETRVKKKFFSGHSILHYINKDDVGGEAPKNPASDPQYLLWEAGIQKWAEKNNMVIEPVPTTYDDVHVGGNTPSVSFVSPSPNISVTDSVTVAVQIDSPRQISRVVYSVDGVVLATSSASPDFRANLSLANFDNGSLQIKATAYDDVQNSTSQLITVFLNSANAIPSVIWISPQQGLSVTAIDYPFNAALRINHSANVLKITVTEQRNNDAPQMIAESINPGKILEFIIPKKSRVPGTYRIRAVLQLKNGETVTSDPLTMIHS